MRGVSVIRAAALAVVLLGGAAARAADEAPVFDVQYVDVAPRAQAKVSAILVQARLQARKTDGNLGFQAYTELGRPGRFAVVSAWRDQKALDAYGASVDFKQWHAALDPVRVTAVDERAFALIAGDPLGDLTGRPAAGRAAVHVITHMDSIPTFKDEAAAALKKLAEASLKDAGLVRYQVLVQTNRGNHFQLLETWRDQKALDAHVAAAHTRQFRDAVQSGAGSPYDERLYKALD
jgi:quinol monooxygenase YgiN